MYSSIIFMLKPIALNIYVKRRYALMNDTIPDDTAISQRWDGLAHHLAFFLRKNTDVLVLTFFSNLKEISVYSVYLMISSGLEKILGTVSSGMEAAFGNMIAKKESEAIKRNLQIYEFIIFTTTTIFFTVGAVLSVSFVSLYTKGVEDVNYIREAFAYTLLFAEAIYCIRKPYHSIVMAAGYFKETKNGAYAEALINILLSLILVHKFGITGVAFATLIAVSVRTIQYVLFLSANILYRPFSAFLKRLGINIFLGIAIVIYCNSFLNFSVNSYFMWVMYAIIVTMVTTLIILTINSIVFSKDCRQVLKLVKRITTKGKS